MRIIHVTGYFAEDMAYQENLLPIGQAKLGHEVHVLTGRYEPDFGFNHDSRKKTVETFIYKGVSVHRLEDYFEITNRGPILKGLLNKIKALRPDILFIHDIGTSLITGIIYKLLNPSILLQVDCHSTTANARNSLIGPMYHGFFKLVFILFKQKFDKFFAIAPETIDFMCRYYGFVHDEITLLPLPGDSSDLHRAKEIRASVRSELRIREDEFVIIHTGKLPGDKETESVLQAFANINNGNIRLIIAGSVEKEFMPVFNNYLLKDPRIIYLGWVKAVRLREVFYACDLLVQPGSLSNTFIDAICCGLPVLLDDTPQGNYLTSRGNGKVVKRGSIDRLVTMINECLSADELVSLKNSAKEASIFYGYENNAKMSLEHLN